MCSYNRINSVYACENATTLGILKNQFGFDGFVMSDWGATHSTAPAAKAGLDMEMNISAGTYFGSALQTAVQNGEVPLSRLNDMVLRIVRVMFRVGIFDHPAAAQPAAYSANVSTPEHVVVARKISEEGTVLLKNAGGVLPLTGQGRRIALIGPAAGQHGAELSYNGQGSGHVPLGGFNPVVSPLQGMQQRAQANGDTVTYSDGSSMADAVATAKAADVVIVFANDAESEGVDRPDLTLGNGYFCALAACAGGSVNQDQLIAQVVAANPNTVVVLNTGGPVLMPWLDQVKGLLEAWYPGIEDGNAIAAILYGDVNPSAKLPETFPRAMADLPTRTAAQYPGVNDTAGVPHSHYSEGLLVGYRWYDARGIAPLFPFGFGLSYTTFDYRNLKVDAASNGSTVGTAGIDVTNTGQRSGADVPQLYVADPASTGEPPKQLAGYQKLSLNPGETGRASFAIDQRSLSYWDTNTHAWRVAPGCYGLLVGHSSRDVSMQATVSVDGASCPGAAASFVTHAQGVGTTAPCLTRRSVRIRLLRVRRSSVRQVTVYLNGRRARTLRGHRVVVPVSFNGRPAGVVRVRLVVRTAKGRRVLRRAYTLCAAKPTHHRHRHARKRARRR
jgi:beta-glucosidase